MLLRYKILSFSWRLTSGALAWGSLSNRSQLRWFTDTPVISNPPPSKLTLTYPWFERTCRRVMHVSGGQTNTYICCFFQKVSSDPPPSQVRRRRLTSCSVCCFDFMRVQFSFLFCMGICLARHLAVLFFVIHLHGCLYSRFRSSLSFCTESRPYPACPRRDCDFVHRPPRSRSANYFVQFLILAVRCAPFRGQRTH